MRTAFALAKLRPAHFVAWLLVLIFTRPLLADNPNRRVLIRDITSVEGVRDNMLVGYGLVVGLNRTGDSQQTYFTVQTLANAMQKMGVLISPAQVEVKNVPFGVWMGWLDEVRRSDHVRVVSAHATGEAQPGHANVSVTVQPAAEQ